MALDRVLHGGQAPRSEAEYLAEIAARKRSKPADFHLQHCGSVTLITPLTDGAARWIEAHCAAETWQWLNGTLAIDPRCADTIVAGLIADGFTLAD